MIQISIVPNIQPYKIVFIIKNISNMGWGWGAMCFVTGVDGSQTVECVMTLTRTLGFSSRWHNKHLL